MTDTPIWGRLPSDTDKSYDAFCIYRDMGANRSLRDVAQQLNKSLTIIARWSTSHEWVNRVTAYDDYQRDLTRQRIEHKRIEIEADAMADYDAIRKAIAKRIEILESGNYVAKPSDLHDLISLMEHANSYARLNSGLPDKIAQSRHDIGNADGKPFKMEWSQVMRIDPDDTDDPFA